MTTIWDQFYFIFPRFTPLSYRGRFFYDDGINCIINSTGVINHIKYGLLIKRAHILAYIIFIVKHLKYFYSRDIDESISKVQAMSEPALTVVMGLILGWIMLAVLGPIYDTISKMKT